MNSWKYWKPETAHWWFSNSDPQTDLKDYWQCLAISSFWRGTNVKTIMKGCNLQASSTAKHNTQHMRAWYKTYELFWTIRSVRTSLQLFLVPSLVLNCPRVQVGKAHRQSNHWNVGANLVQCATTWYIYNIQYWFFIFTIMSKYLIIVVSCIRLEWTCTRLNLNLMIFFILYSIESIPSSTIFTHYCTIMINNSFNVEQFVFWFYIQFQFKFQFELLYNMERYGHKVCITDFPMYNWRIESV